MGTIIKPMFLLLLLAGCGQGDNNHGHGFHFDQQGPTGLRIRYVDESSIRLETVELVWIDTQACIEASVNAPLVIWSTELPETGIAYLDTNTVILRQDPAMTASVVENNMRHEFMHLILFWSGLLPNAEDHLNHNWLEWSHCDEPTGIL